MGAWASFVGPLLDRTVVLSFDRTGYARHVRAFRPTDLPADLRGKTCLVTGANSGIGKATAAGLAARGATVFLLCRSRRRGEQARDDLIDQSGNPGVHLRLVDLSSLASVHSAVRTLPCDRVDVLVHNAGVLPDERIITEDGLELTLATNLVGPFLLTRLLADRLAGSPDARIVHVSSGGMYSQKLSVSALASTRGTFDGVRAYAQTKRALVTLTELLMERMRGTSLTVHGMHPGWVDTPAVRTSLPRFHLLTRRILRSPEQGADTVLWLAIADAPRLRPGRFWFDRQEQRTHWTRLTRESQAERDELWTSLCRWARVPPDLPLARIAAGSR